MALTYKFFRRPFAEDGDLTAIPDDAQGSGSVSYQEGWTSDYQLTYGTTGAKAIPRDQSNELAYDITKAIQQYQTVGAPEWIAAADNDGVDYEYVLYARVRYDDGGGVKEYESQVAANTATPGADSSWRVISGGAEGVPTGTVIDFASPTPPAGFLSCTGAAVSRTTYVTLFNIMAFTQTPTFTALSQDVSGLTDATTSMYIGMPIESASVPVGTTVASIVDDNNITIAQAATASGADDAVFFPFGNGDGSTTFNIPDFRRRVAVGSGGTGTSDLGSVTGETGGEEAHVQTEAEMAAHVHPPLAGADFYNSAITGELYGGNNVNFGLSATTGSAGSSQAANVMQPSVVMTKCIKY